MTIMTDEELYRFDLEGYIAIPNALSRARLKKLNAIFDEKIAEVDEEGMTSHRFGDLFEWGKPYRDLIDLPKILPYLHEIIGPHPRVDHIYADLIRKGLSPIGASLHGGSAPFDPSEYFRFQDGRMYNGLCVVAYNLRDVGPEDGGFACVPGSHKSNYPLPNEWKDMTESLHPVVKRVPGPAGTAILFTEALTHGPLPWTADHERRTIFFKYSPHPVSWSARYFNAADYPGLTKRQQAMLEAPNARYGTYERRQAQAKG